MSIAWRTAGKMVALPVYICSTIPLSALARASLKPRTAHSHACSALALLTVVALKASGSDISDGLYGYSPVLTAIALATVFYKPNFRSALWAVLGILVTVFIQAGMYMLMAPVGIATLTGPFCITTWLFLLPLVRFDDEEKPDHSNWYPENKKHLVAQQPGAKTE